jgi:ATP-binding cassette subfamily B protein
MTTGPVLPTNFVLLLALLAGVNLVSQVVQHLIGTAQRLHHTRVTNYIQLLIAEKAVEIDLACFEDAEFHNQLRMAAAESAYKPMVFIQQLMQATATLVTFTSLATVVLLWHAWILPFVVIASLATLWVSIRFGTARVQLITQRSETERKKYYLLTLVTSDQAAKELRLFGLRNFLLTNLQNLTETLYQQDRRLAVREQLYSGIAGSILALVQPALFAFTAFQSLQGAISIGQFSLYTQSITQLSGQVTQLLLIAGSLHESNLFAAQLLSFLRMQPQVEAPRSEPKVCLATITRTPHIEFRNISFQYPGTARAVLQNVSFEVRPGEAIALVGENGAGKTTLVKLLAGLYEPTEGNILLDGVDIRFLDRDDLRAYLSVIFQDYTIYHLSARENIGLQYGIAGTDMRTLQLAQL